jgi:hypothetical protein
MVDPVTLGVVGAGVSAAGALFGGISGAQASRYQASVAKNNAIIAEQNASYSMEAGEAQAERTSLKGAAQSGQIKAAQAASGVDVNSGSAENVQISQKEVNQLDTDTTLNNAQLQAYGYRTQAANDEAQAALDKSQANNDLIGGGLNAAGSLLGNASSLSFKWGGGSTPDTSDASLGTGLSGSSNAASSLF